MAFRSGYVAVLGKPNVGKSTLINALVGQKVSIVSNKPQTTRRRVLGIRTTETHQIAFVDTPGIHEAHTRLGRAMNEQARGSLGQAEVILFVVDGSKRPNDEDKQIAAMLKTTTQPVVLCLNKMDKLRAEDVQPNVDEYSALVGTEEFMLTQATRGLNIDKLAAILVEHLPERAPIYDADEFTDQSSRFMTSEFVREKILQRTRQEVPHATAVAIEDWSENDRGLVSIAATIIVEKASQRAILIGKQGQFIKAIGTDARAEIEELLGKKVFLELHVKVQEGWRQNPRVIADIDAQNG